MKIVNGFNKKREIVKKELHTSKSKGAFLRYNGEDVILEPDLKLWEKVYRPNEKSEGYLNAFYHMTNKCNKHCKHCYNRDLVNIHPGNTTLEQLITSLEEFVPKDTREIVPFKKYVFDGVHPTVSYIGGEPTVADTTIPFTNYIHNTRNNKIYIYTNGIKLLDIDYLKQFPNTNQIIWSISTDIDTEESFLRKITENIKLFNFEYAYNIVINKDALEKNIEIDKICRDYNPQEIRYRSCINQPKGTSDSLSSIIKIIEKIRGISYDYFLDNAHFRHGVFVSSLSYNKTDNPNTGNVAIAILPVWRKTFAEVLCKWGSFVLNTKGINTPGECHMSSSDLFKWRMKHTEDYITEGTKIIWGKINTNYGN
jgi:MoaA/NifB/PqqE/SkfB family radical SAM enzyme